MFIIKETVGARQVLGPQAESPGMPNFLGGRVVTWHAPIRSKTVSGSEKIGSLDCH